MKRVTLFDIVFTVFVLLLYAVSLVCIFLWRQELHSDLDLAMWLMLTLGFAYIWVGSMRHSSVLFGFCSGMIISLLAIVLPVAIFNLDGSNLISAVLLSVPAGMLPAGILGAWQYFDQRRKEPGGT